MAEKKSAAKKKPVAKKTVKAEKKVEREKAPVNPKMADPDIILDGYDELIKKLSEVEAEQRRKSKPYRIYFVHRKRLEVMKINFIKSMR